MLCSCPAGVTILRMPPGVQSGPRGLTSLNSGSSQQPNNLPGGICQRPFHRCGWRGLGRAAAHPECTHAAGRVPAARPSRLLTPALWQQDLAPSLTSSSSDPHHATPSPELFPSLQGTCSFHIQPWGHVLCSRGTPSCYLLDPFLAGTWLSPTCTAHWSGSPMRTVTGQTRPQPSANTWQGAQHSTAAVQNSNHYC